jgi:hypothetical protein
MSVWTSQTSAANNAWRSVTYGSGLFVAVATSGTGNRVMTSPDGINWTLGTSAADNFWRSVTYGSGLFVAVASNGTGNRVMTSPDGITWTSQTSPDNSWFGVTYGNGLFVAVASNGTGNRVMTSPDGITWTSQTSAADNTWYAVTYGSGLFVAVSTDGDENRVMTSPDGITWTSRTSAADNYWGSVTYGSGLFVAVAYNGDENRVMTSPDGITWTSQTSPDNSWFGVTYGNGLFVAVAIIGNRVMTSPDGINWTLGTSAADNFWRSVTYGSGLFVAVSESGTGNRVMTSPHGKVLPTLSNFTIPAKTYASGPFTLTPPTSNSNGEFTYSSSDTSVATISGNTLTILRGGPVTITATQAETSSYLSGTISFEFIVSNICFPAGTPIVTDQGFIPIEKINSDIHTIRNKKIIGITKTYSNDKFLVCFEKDALGDNIPSKKTIMSKNHEILYKGKMIKAKEFVEIFENVYKIKYKGEMLYNVLMEKHDKMIVNNLICETLHPENIVAILYTTLKNLLDEKEKNIVNMENNFSVKNKVHNCRK